MELPEPIQNEQAPLIELPIVSEPYTPTGKEVNGIERWQSRFQPLQMTEVLRKAHARFADRGYDQALKWWKQNPQRSVAAQYLLGLMWLGLLIGFVFLLGFIRDRREAWVEAMGNPVLLNDSTAHIAAVVLFFLGLLGCIVAYFLMMALSKNNELQAPLKQTFILDQDGLTLGVRDTQELTPWGHFCTWNEADDFFVLLDVRYNWTHLPKSCYSDEQLRMVRSLLRRELFKAKLKKAT